MPSLILNLFDLDENTEHKSISSKHTEVVVHGFENNEEDDKHIPYLTSLVSGASNLNSLVLEDTVEDDKIKTGSTYETFTKVITSLAGKKHNITSLAIRGFSGILESDDEFDAMANLIKAANIKKVTLAPQLTNEDGAFERGTTLDKNDKKLLAELRKRGVNVFSERSQVPKKTSKPSSASSIKTESKLIKSSRDSEDEFDSSEIKRTGTKRPHDDGDDDEYLSNNSDDDNDDGNDEDYIPPGNKKKLKKSSTTTKTKTDDDDDVSARTDGDDDHDYNDDDDDDDISSTSGDDHDNHGDDDDDDNDDDNTNNNHSLSLSSSSSSSSSSSLPAETPINAVLVHRKPYTLLAGITGPRRHQKSKDVTKEDPISALERQLKVSQLFKVYGAKKKRAYPTFEDANTQFKLLASKENIVVAVDFSPLPPATVFKKTDYNYLELLAPHESLQRVLETDYGRMGTTIYAIKLPNDSIQCYWFDKSKTPKKLENSVIAPAQAREFLPYFEPVRTKYNANGAHAKLFYQIGYLSGYFKPKAVHPLSPRIVVKLLKGLKSEVKRMKFIKEKSHANFNRVILPNFVPSLEYLEQARSTITGACIPTKNGVVPLTQQDIVQLNFIFELLPESVKVVEVVNGNREAFIAALLPETRRKIVKRGITLEFSEAYHIKTYQQEQDEIALEQRQKQERQKQLAEAKEQKEKAKSQVSAAATSSSSSTTTPGIGGVSSSSTATPNAVSSSSTVVPPPPPPMPPPIPTRNTLIELTEQHYSSAYQAYNHYHCCAGSLGIATKIELMQLTKNALDYGFKLQERLTQDVAREFRILADTTPRTFPSAVQLRIPSPFIYAPSTGAPSSSSSSSLSSQPSGSPSSPSSSSSVSADQSSSESNIGATPPSTSLNGAGTSISIPFQIRLVPWEEPSSSPEVASTQSSADAEPMQPSLADQTPSSSAVRSSLSSAVTAPISDNAPLPNISSGVSGGIAPLTSASSLSSTAIASSSTTISPRLPHLLAGFRSPSSTLKRDQSHPSVSAVTSSLISSSSTTSFTSSSLSSLATYDSNPSSSPSSPNTAAGVTSASSSIGTGGDKPGLLSKVSSLLPRMMF